MDWGAKSAEDDAPIFPYRMQAPMYMHANLVPVVCSLCLLCSLKNATSFGNQIRLLSSVIETISYLVYFGLSWLSTTWINNSIVDFRSSWILLFFFLFFIKTAMMFSECISFVSSRSVGVALFVIKSPFVKIFFLLSLFLVTAK